MSYVAKMTVTSGRGPKGNQRTKDAIKRCVIEAFERTGNSSHTSQATLLQFLIDYCDEKGYSYFVVKLAGQHSVGWYIQKFDAERQTIKLANWEELSAGDEKDGETEVK